MTVSAAILSLGLLVGIPLAVLAAAVAYHAVVLARQGGLARVGERVESDATEGVDELLLEMQRAIEEIHGQMSRQRDILRGLLSDAARPERLVRSARRPAAPYAGVSAFAADLSHYDEPATPAAAGAPRPLTAAYQETVGRPFSRDAMVQDLAGEGVAHGTMRRLGMMVDEVRAGRGPVQDWGHEISHEETYEQTRESGGR